MLGVTLHPSLGDGDMLGQVWIQNLQGAAEAQEPLNPKCCGSLLPFSAEMDKISPALQGAVAGGGGGGLEPGTPGAARVQRPVPDPTISRLSFTKETLITACCVLWRLQTEVTVAYP